MKTRTFRNPIIAADVPDPDAIRLADGTYCLVASSFDRRPALPLWLSRDLMTWTPIGHAGSGLDQSDTAHAAIDDGGVWAPVIRQHDGLLYVVWGDPDRGVFVVTAPDVRGPWSAPRLLLAGHGIIDPCPYWDADGRTYLVHAWARSRAGFANRFDIIEVDAALTYTLGEGRVLIDGDAIPGCSVLEGPKVYWRHGQVWIFAPAGGVAEGWQYVFRADTINAHDWEHRIVLEQGASPINGPHQGAWVPGDDGEDWFLHFQQTPVHGRVLHLQPMLWPEGEWPLLGQAAFGGANEPVLDHPTPRGGSTAPPVIWWGDTFRSQTLSPRWHTRGADPDALVELPGDGRLILTAHEHASLGMPVDARWQRSRIVLTDLDADATLQVATDTTGPAVVLRREGASVYALTADGSRERAVDLPVTLGVTWSARTARIALNGVPLTEAPLVARRWTGAEISVSVRGQGAATFADLVVD